MSNPQGTYEDKAVICGLPSVPPRQLDQNIDPNREALIRHIEKKWVNHTILHYCFLDEPLSIKGSDVQKGAVRDAFNEWKNLGIGLQFQEVTDPAQAEIRIGFLPGGSWSYVGRDTIDLVPNPGERTMNFGWDLTTPYGRDTALHEIGHSLGFPHEHQNPNAGIVWNEDAVYNYFAGPPNFWSHDKTQYNVIRKISSEEVQGSQWDRNSIMHYQFRAGLIQLPEEYMTHDLIPEPGLSEYDISEVKRFYPPGDTDQFPELKPFLSQIIDLAPGEQVDFTIKPTVSRKYTMQTFGSLDTVMVLFEDVNGESVYLDGDDDSGSNFNAKIEARLLAGRTYYLRLRLYYATATGIGAAMVW